MKKFDEKTFGEFCGARMSAIANGKASELTGEEKKSVDKYIADNVCLSHDDPDSEYAIAECMNYNSDQIENFAKRFLDVMVDALAQSGEAGKAFAEHWMDEGQYDYDWPALVLFECMYQGTLETDACNVDHYDSVIYDIAY